MSDEQALLKESLRQFLAKESSFARTRELEAGQGADHELWRSLAAAGYLGILWPSELGGDSGDLTQTAIVLEELTRHACAVPFMETAVCSTVIARFGPADEAKRCASEVMAGRIQMSPAVEESRFPKASDVVVEGNRLTGSRAFVDYGQSVTHHLVLGRDGADLGLFLVAANGPGVKVELTSHIGRTPQANVNYVDVASTKVGGSGAVEFLKNVARGLAAVQCFGNAARSFEMTIPYVTERSQFGRPIGSFQAVQHHCADMAISLEAAGS